MRDLNAFSALSIHAVIDDEHAHASATIDNIIIDNLRELQRPPLPFTDDYFFARGIPNVIGRIPT